MKRLFLSLLSATFVIISGSAFVYGEDLYEGESSGEEPCLVEAISGGVGCLFSDGTTKWRIEHPSLWDDVDSYLAREEERFPVGPILVGARAFYGVRADLLELDLEAGRVMRRRRFPAPIVAIESIEGRTDQVKIVINFVEWNATGTGEEIEIRQDLDAPGPSQNVWAGKDYMLLSLSAKYDADWLKKRGDGVVEAAKRDPVNLFLLGHLEEELENGAGIARWTEALEAQGKAAGAAWTDGLAISWRLEAQEETRDLAEKVYEAALEQMSASAISPQRMSALINHIVRHLDALVVIEEAVQKGELVRVEALSERIVAISPLVEGGDYAWVSLADWLEAQWRDGEVWRVRGERNRQDSFSMSGHDARRIDLLVPIMVGLMVALFLYTFLVGLRRGVKGTNPWVSASGLLDILGVLLVAVALISVNSMLVNHILIVGQIATAPVNLADDTLAAPDVEAWLENLAAGEARDRLLEIARQEREALEGGFVRVDKTSVFELVHQAVMNDALRAQRKSLVSGQVANPLTTVSLGGGRTLHTLSFLGVVAFLLILVLIMIVGGFVGRFVPVVGRWGPLMVPGGAKLLAPLGGLLLAGFIAGWTAVLGFDQVMTSITGAQSGQYFGLDSIVDQEYISPGRLWAWSCIVVALVLHGIAVAIERHTEGIDAIDVKSRSRFDGRSR